MGDVKLSAVSGGRLFLFPGEGPVNRAVARVAPVPEGAPQRRAVHEVSFESAIKVNKQSGVRLNLDREMSFAFNRDENFT